MRKAEAIVGISLLTLVFYTLGLSAWASTQRDMTVSNSGAMRTVGVEVYWNMECTNQISSINWGLLDPGSNNNLTCYIRNEGNSVSTLSMYTTNWNPSDTSQYITLSWDCEGQTINPNQIIEATFTLSVSETTEGITIFTFDTTIVGSS